MFKLNHLESNWCNLKDDDTRGRFWFSSMLIHVDPRRVINPSQSISFLTGCWRRSQDDSSGACFRMFSKDVRFQWRQLISRYIQQMKTIEKYYDILWDIMTCKDPARVLLYSFVGFHAGSVCQVLGGFRVSSSACQVPRGFREWGFAWFCDVLRGFRASGFARLPRDASARILKK